MSLTRRSAQTVCLPGRERPAASACLTARQGRSWAGIEGGSNPHSARVTCWRHCGPDEAEALCGVQSPLWVDCVEKVGPMRRAANSAQFLAAATSLHEATLWPKVAGRQLLSQLASDRTCQQNPLPSAIPTTDASQAYGRDDRNSGRRRVQACQAMDPACRITGSPRLRHRRQQRPAAADHRLRGQVPAPGPTPVAPGDARRRGRWSDPTDPGRCR